MGLNVSKDVYLENVKSASRRDLPWLDQSMFVFDGECAIIGGAPSLKHCLDEIRELPKETMIFSVNGTHDYLLENDIRPDFFVMLDSRPVNDFANNPQPDCLYLLASQCHKSVFDKLDDNHVVVFHAETEDFPFNYVRQRSEKRDMGGYRLIASKGTVGMTSIALASTMGFTRFRLYGMDSSFTNDHHAYKQPQNDGDRVIEHEFNGKLFKTTPALCNQMFNFAHLCNLLEEQGCEIIMRSKGLIKEVFEHREVT